MKRFVDVMCGGVIASLRMCGYNTVYAGDRGLVADDALLAVARAENCTRSSPRDVQLERRTDEAILLESRDVEGQLAALTVTGLEL